MRILSIQSWVADGHVGNAATLFPLQRLGAEVAAIHTVQFSNHPGHGAFTGRVKPPEEVAALVDGLAAHGTLARCDGLLTGYIGDAGTGAVALRAAGLMRAARPAALWCCDPVMGDDGRLYVRPELPGFFSAQAMPASDLVTPNQFELGLLAGAPVDTLAQVREAACRLRARLRPAGPRVVLVTSLRAAETPADRLHMLLLADEAWLLSMELLPAKFFGAGDLLAALFLFHVLNGLAPALAAQRAAASLWGILRHTLAAGEAELQTVAAQGEFLAPTGRVSLERL